MKDNFEDTMHFKKNKDENLDPKEILLYVYQALEEKGYNAVNQLIGYLLSGDPAYITSHKGARNLIRGLERDELLEELLKFYLENNR
ncbi:MAG: hypothetical protein XD50_0707 [Clostridia bacterium 41_269]|nr:MAG: hypothetical protein XD50_0707 [Clostridia bacterium 41_269]